MGSGSLCLVTFMCLGLKILFCDLVVMLWGRVGSVGRGFGCTGEGGE